MKIFGNVLLPLLLCLTSVLSGTAQCAFDGSLTISDQQPIEIDLLVSGALNNYLGDNNCLEAIDLQFSHSYIVDVKMILVSPSGQMIEVVSPASSGANTPNITWTVQIVNESEVTAMPHPGTPDVWTSAFGWEMFVPYMGSYYPSTGNLDSYTGSVNGVWKLLITDQAQLDEGEITCTGLTFCDDTGVSVASCSPVGSILEVEAIEACASDPILNVNIQPQLSEEYDSSAYSYTYLIFNDGAFFKTSATADLSSEGAGMYTVCGLNFFLDDQSEVDLIPLGASSDEVDVFLMDNGACYERSADCFDVVINSLPDTVMQEVVLCDGDSLVIGGVSYREAGLFEVVTAMSPCDSVSYLDIELVTLDLSAEADMTVLSCDLDTLMLDASASNIEDGVVAGWVTFDGNIIGSQLEDTIFVNKSGTYSYQATTMGCVLTTDVVITEDSSFVQTDIDVAQITCASDSAMITLMTSDSIVDLTWDSDQDFRQDGNNIITGRTGIYSLEFATNFGCVVSRDIEVIDTRVYPDFELYFDTINCTVPQVQIGTANVDTLGSSFIWIKDDEVLGLDTFQIVDEPGLYNLRVTTAEGCVDSFSVEVPTQVEDIDAILFGGMIDCDEPEVDVAYSSSFGNLTSLWTLPDESNRVDSAFTSSLEGMYKLTLRSNKGCTLDTFLVVDRDTNIPEVEVVAPVFTCGQDSVQIMSSVNLDSVTYLWTNEAGFVDTTAIPWIFAPGEYMVEVCTDNGCCDRDTFMAGVDEMLPVLDFDFQNINCFEDTIYITPSDTATYVMDWTLDGDSITVDSNIIRVTEVGDYGVVVTNPDNGCFSTYTFEILDDRVDTLVGLTVNPLTCIDQEVQIRVTPDRVLQSFQWTGPGLLDTDIEPTVNQPGIYYIDYQYENGCSNRDSIVVIDEAEDPALSGVGRTITCAAPSVTLEVEYESSDVFVRWDGPDFDDVGTSVLVSEAGIYTAYAVGPGACLDTLTLVVDVDTIYPMVSMINDGDITCADSIVQIDATLGPLVTSFEFEGPGIVGLTEETIFVNQAGFYMITTMGDNGCITVDTNEVFLSTDFPEYEVILDSLTCVKDEVMVGFISPDPSLLVEWTGVQPVADDTYDFVTSLAGNYSFALTNSNGCRIEDSLFVVRDTFVPDGGILKSSELTCAFEMADFSVENDDLSWNVEWQGPGVSDPNARSFSTDNTGQYSVILTGRNGCVTYDTIGLVYDTIPPVITVIGDAISCTAGKVFLRVSSDKELEFYDWSGPDEFSSAMQEPLVEFVGEYQVIVTALNGCTAQGSYEVVDQRVFPEIEVEDYYLPCDGDPAVVTYETITEGANTRWFGPNNFFAATDTVMIFVAGQYVGAAVTDDGCTTRDTFEVIDEPVPPIFDADGNTLLCFGPVALEAIDVEDDRSIIWQGPGGFMSQDMEPLVSEPGEYTLTVTSTNGCDESKTVVLIDGRVYPDVVAANNDLFQCSNLEINLSGDGSSIGSQYSYLWTTDNGQIISGATTLSPLINDEGDYILTIINNDIGCVSSDTLNLVKQPQSLIGVDLEIIPPTCLGYENGIIDITEVLGGFGPFDITLDGVSYGERLDIQYLDVGEYELVIEDSLGCIIDTMAVISANSILTVDLPEDTLLTFGQSLMVDPQISLSSDSITEITWSSNVMCAGCDSLDIIPYDNMTISIKVIDINGCEVRDEFRVTVDRPNVLPFPQIFSPNGDGANDIFYLPMTEGLEMIDYVKVYDNWGGLLYERKGLLPGDPTLGWNGTINGQEAAEGVFIVESVVTLVDGTQVRYLGDLTLIR